MLNQDTENDPHPSVVDFRAACSKADGFILAPAEYNFSISPPMTNAIAWASRGPLGNLFADKPGSLMSAGGGLGALRAQMHLRDMALGINLHLLNFPFVTVNIFAAPAQFDLNTGDLIHSTTEKSVEIQMEALLAWIKRLDARRGE